MTYPSKKTTPPLPFQVTPSPTNTFMVDIETAGTGYGSAILEIAAAEFNPRTGEILREWSTPVDLLDCCKNGLVIDQDTAAWHLMQNNAPELHGAPLWRALNALWTFLHMSTDEPVVWAWGIDFETMHLKAACEAVGYVMPWKHWQGRCARTVWKVCCQGPASKKTHRAAEDVRIQIQDLHTALDAHLLT